MAFVQLVEFTSKDTDQIRTLTARYQEETKGSRTTLRALICADRDLPDRYVVVTEFASYDDAMAKLTEGPLSYRNLEVIETLTG